MSTLRQEKIEAPLISLAQEKVLVLADKETVIHSTHQVSLDVCIFTVAGRTIIRNVRFYVIDEPLLEILIGLEILEMLGISPMQSLIAKQKSREGLLDVHSSNSHSLQRMTLMTKVIQLKIQLEV